jgi:CHAT domain
MIDEYLNLELHLFAHQAGADGSEGFRVQVAASPVGEQAASETVLVPAGLRQQLARLEARQLDLAQTIALGQVVADLMLPPGARDFFLTSLARLGSHQGLRLRLRCESVELDGIPWEIAHVERGLSGAGSALGRRGFIVLDSRISLVRRELCSLLINPPRRQREQRRLLTLLCEPADRRDPQRPLQVEQELAQLRGAIDGLPGIELVNCAQATRQALSDLLLDGADIFHFAGHGEFRRATEGGSHAYLLLQREDGRSDEWEVDELALRLANKGIQLALLGACRSAQSDGRSAWAGIAPSLARAGIPAVIGMQYTVFDASAVAFSRRLYRAWSQLGTLDEAMSEARSAILDVDADTGRDFATPVLYLREDSGIGAVLRPVVTEPPALPRAEELQGDDLSPLLALLTEVYDYKLVHDALHSMRTREFNLIVMRREEFPGGSTLREFGSHARELRKRLQDIRRVAAQGRCEAALMTDIVDEFAAAMALLEQALQTQAVEPLEDAVAAFESLLATQPVRVDTWMNSLAQRMELERMVAFVRSLPLCETDTTPAVEDLRQLGEQLRLSAMLHSQCQAIDNRLAVIRKSGEPERFREIRRQWKPLSASLEKILPLWCPSDLDALRQASEQLSAGVAANDERLARDAFDELCNDFDYGFYTVDSDFKQLCGRMKQQAEARLPLRQAGV